jgi:hypothetical protein
MFRHPNAIKYHVGYLAPVTVRLSLNLIIGRWGDALDKETELVSGETCVTVCIAVRGIERWRMM